MIDPATMPERCYTMLKSLNEFERHKIRGVVSGMLAKTDRDWCFIGNYLRGVANVETLLYLKSTKDLQAIAMIARSLFELAVDVKLIDLIPNAVQKIGAFSAFERLRAARKIIAFKVANSTCNLDVSSEDAFVTANSAQIDTEQAASWPGAKKPVHWSGMHLSQRVALLKAPLTKSTKSNIPG
jgi:hypothetical protein